MSDIAPTVEQEHLSQEEPCSASTDSDNQLLWLSIASGVQAGAKTPLFFGQSVIVGPQRDCDIVLRDPGAGLSKIRLTHGADGLELYILDGIVVVDSEAIDQTPEIKQFAHSQAMPEIALPADHASRDAALPESEGNSEISTLAAPEEAMPPPSKWYGQAGAVVALLILVGGIGLWLKGAMSGPQVQRASMSTLLESSPFSGLEVNEDDGAIELTGFLESLDEAAQLDQFITLSGYQVDNKVLIGERIRVLEHVEDLVLADVPGIASVEIDNQPPPLTDEEKAAIPIDPGKRVAMVVSDTVKTVLEF